VTQDDDRASLSSVAKTSLSVGASFVPVGTSERLPTRTTRDVWFGTIRELSMESMWHVDQVSPCRVYIDSNHHDSQI
jgi:hypothetical protein